MTPCPQTTSSRRARFEAAFCRIAYGAFEDYKKQGVPEAVIEWYRKSLEYIIPGGKLNRGMSVVDTVEILKGRPLTDDEYFKAAVLGWCNEMLQAYMLVVDDIMDASITRRGKTCWYRKAGVGMIAMKDAAIGSMTIFRIVKSFFKGEPYYVDICELFLETCWQTEIGQLADLISAPKEIDLSKFTLDRHSFIVRWKTSYYSFYLPVACAMYMCGIPSKPEPTPDNPTPAKDAYDIAKSILIPLGEYFQTQDDYIDFAGSPATIGKIGTDIVDNKCSWCIITAMLYASPEQRSVLEENYGRGSPGGENEQRVKAIFEEVGLREKYADYEETAVKGMKDMIAAIPETEGENSLRREIFDTFLRKIYKRNT